MWPVPVLPTNGFRQMRIEIYTGGMKPDLKPKTSFFLSFFSASFLLQCESERKNIDVVISHAVFKPFRTLLFIYFVLLLLLLILSFLAYTQKGRRHTNIKIYAFFIHVVGFFCTFYMAFDTHTYSLKPIMLLTSSIQIHICAHRCESESLTSTRACWGTAKRKQPILIIIYYTELNWFRLVIPIHLFLFFYEFFFLGGYTQLTHLLLKSLCSFFVFLSFSCIHHRSIWLHFFFFCLRSFFKLKDHS